MAKVLELFHGTPTDFNTFTVDKVGNGHDQEGPGIYLTNNRQDALYYMRGKGFLFTLKVTLNKVVPLKGKVNRAQVIKLMKAAPNLNDTLENWDENPHRAFLTALDGMLNNETPHQVFQSVWYDFYKNTPQNYVTNMYSMLGYDGVIIPKPQKVGMFPSSFGMKNLIHVIVFNPHSIQIINKEALIVS
jgi:hypothetical protein